MRSHGELAISRMPVAHVVRGMPLSLSIPLCMKNDLSLK